MKYTEYRGRKMIVGWPEKIEEAQTITSIEVDGKVFSRIAFGEEACGRDTSRPCRDCGVLEGEFHVLGCLVERCPKCGDQLHGCSCKKKEHHLH